MNIEAIKKILEKHFFLVREGDYGCSFSDIAMEIAALFEPPPDSSRLLTDDELGVISDSVYRTDMKAMAEGEFRPDHLAGFRWTSQRQDAKTARVLEPQIWAEYEAECQAKIHQLEVVHKATSDDEMRIHLKEIKRAVAQARLDERAKCKAEATATKEAVLEAVAQGEYKLMVTNDECEAKVKEERAKVLKEVGEWIDSINFSDYDIEGVIASFQHYSVEDLKQGKAPWDSLKAGGKEKGE